MSEQELDNMLAEVGGTCNFENMLKCFEVKLTGEGMANDGDELVLEAMKAYNETSKNIYDYSFESLKTKILPLKFYICPCFLFDIVIEVDKKKGTIITHLTSPALLKHVLMTFDDKMNQEEIDDMFEEFELDDDGMILTKSIVIYSYFYSSNFSSYYFHIIPCPVYKT